MFCKNCGKEIDDNAVVCPHCGVATRATAPANQPQAKESNGMAIAGFVLALLGFNVIALILSIIGYNKSKQLGGSGKGLAIAGIVIASIYLVIYCIVLPISCGALSAAIGEMASAAAL